MYHLKFDSGSQRFNPNSDLNQISHCYIKGLSAGEIIG